MNADHLNTIEQWRADSTLPGWQEICDTFELFDDWEDRYRYVIELGKGLAALPDAWRSEETLVRGCQSQVWLLTAYAPEAQRLRIAIDSDAHIVRGLAAILIASMEDLAPAELAVADPEIQFEQLGLLGHLSPSRGNGLRAMIARLRAAAQALAL